MTNTEKIITIAGACGWKNWESHEKDVPFMWAQGHIATVRAIWQRGNDFAIELPPFLTSLDAIQSAVATQDEQFQAQFAEAMSMTLHDHPNRLSFAHQLLAQDWADCFIETLKSLGRINP